MQSANFGCLDAHDAKLAQLGALVKRDFRNDPSTYLFKRRQFAELIAKLAAAHQSGARDGDDGEAIDVLDASIAELAK